MVVDTLGHGGWGTRAGDSTQEKAGREGATAQARTRETRVRAWGTGRWQPDQYGQRRTHWFGAPLL